MTTDIALALKITNSLNHLTPHTEDLIGIHKGSSFGSSILQAKPKAANPVLGGAARGIHGWFSKQASWPSHGNSRESSYRAFCACSSGGSPAWGEPTVWPSFIREPGESWHGVEALHPKGKSDDSILLFRVQINIFLDNIFFNRMFLLFLRDIKMTTPISSNTRLCILTRFSQAFFGYL